MDPTDIIYEPGYSISASTFWAPIIILIVVAILVIKLPEHAKQKVHEWTRLVGGFLVIISVLWLLVDVVMLVISRVL